MKKKEKSVASKTTLNLAMRDKTGTNPALAILAIIVVAVVAVLVSIGIARELSAVGEAQRTVNAKRERLQNIQSAYADYDEVEAEYNRYTYKDFDRSIADRLDVLDLMERDIFPVCSVRSFSVVGRQLNLVLEGLTLDDTSILQAQLSAERMVETVNVSSYDATSASGAVYPVINMGITLTDASVQTQEVAE